MGCPNETILDIECTELAKKLCLPYSSVRERVRWLLWQHGMSDGDALKQVRQELEKEDESK